MPDLGVHDGPIWVFTITGMRNPEEVPECPIRDRPTCKR